MSAHDTNKLQQIPFVIVDGNPNDKFWIIGKNTEFEFVEIDQNMFYSIMETKNLVRTVQPGKTIHDEKFEMTLDKIEIFENLSRFWFTTREEVCESGKSTISNVCRTCICLNYR